MSTFSRLTSHLRDSIADMSYAQRRLLAHRTGIDLVDNGHISGVTGTAAELEARYASGSRIPVR